ncbi:C39 family peptidase [Actinomadura kijaniata]|uniref:C39 family peptidase n=1 Tax=Actinomadura kijaniata TaxID=46161 RepID=UPI0008374FE8|nr:C39 family peptidase [Actinomadura kijaniata]
MRKSRTIVTTTLLAAALTAPLGTANAQAATLPQVSVAKPVEAQAAKKLTIKTQKQQKSYWCAPAAVRAMATRHRSGSRLPSQAQLARHMKTKPSGTEIRRVLNTLNQMAGRHTYDFNNVGSATRMRNEIRASVNRGHAVYVSVWSQWKPWRKTGTRGASHAIVAYGYSGNTIYWWDPADNSRHSASAAKSYAAMKNRGMRIITG